MKILAENIHWGTYYSITTIASILCLLTLFMTVALLIEAVKDKSAELAFGSVLYFAITVLIAVMLSFELVAGPTISYEAIVTDYNEVYENGYEVIEQNGDITTLRKVVDE